MNDNTVYDSYCHVCGNREYERKDHDLHRGGGIWCKKCKTFKRWLKVANGRKKRPGVSAGDTAEVWAASGGYCAHCGLHESRFGIFGIYKTVQHVPPFKRTGEDCGYMIPLCHWCQEDSAKIMARMDRLIDRILEGKILLPPLRDAPNSEVAAGK